MGQSLTLAFYIELGRGFMWNHDYGVCNHVMALLTVALLTVNFNLIATTLRSGPNKRLKENKTKLVGTACDRGQLAP